jgi:hypothetical protein
MNEGQDGFSDSDDEAQPWALSLNGTVPAVKPTIHAGKWTTEEEVYTEHLIALFVKGALSDCEEGTTLRAYLSEMLNCKPMRITKKYTTEIYDGKLLYVDTDAKEPSPVYLAAVRGNYLQPKVKRSHKKKMAVDYVASTSIIAPVGWLGSTDEEAMMDPDSSCSDEDLDGQLTPKDIEMLVNLSCVSPHNNKISVDDRASNSIIGAVGWQWGLEATTTDESSSMDDDGSNRCSDEDEEGQLTPEDIEILGNLSWSDK